MHDSSLLEYSSDLRPTLLKAFKVFEAQSELLEKSHKELETRLDNAQLSLAQKNRELAKRIAEIEAMKERLSGILESIADSVLLSDNMGNIEIANSSAINLLGADIKKKGLSEWPVLVDLLKSNEYVKDNELTLTIDDVDEIFLVSMIPMTKTTAAKIFKVVSMKKITEHRRLQSRVAQEDRMAALGKVAASVAHEIRNPLCGIEGFAKLLERDLKDNYNAQQQATKIIFATRQLNAVVSNLLNYSREMKEHFETHEIHPVITQVITILQPMTDDRKINIETNFCKEDANSRIDVVQIGQVFTNLLVNAIEACPRRQNRSVIITTRLSRTSIIIECKDDGCGMPKKEINHIFEPFFTTKDGGIGLGLALCKRIIDGHEGTISCESQINKGTTFTIILKRAR